MTPLDSIFASLKAIREYERRRMARVQELLKRISPRCSCKSMYCKDCNP